MADWRLAHALEKLRSQVNTARPQRSKSSDGSIGDAAHASRDSDHNPWISDGTMGVVSAIDLTHDPKGGFDSYRCAEVLRRNKDKRIKYVISNKQIFSSTSQPWVWRPYTGSNPHSQHVHVSVNSAKSQYDNTDAWDLSDLFEAPPPDMAPRPPDQAILRRGDKGPDVIVLQKLLGIDADGYFGPDTEAAVTHFQESRGLVADGVVGGYTWDELYKQDEATTPVNNQVMSNIVCTKFGGSADPNTSAYDEKHVISDEELGCALPYRFSGTRPQVKITNRANGKVVICDIVDVGPWNTTDNYWTLPKGRPQAETGWDMKGRKTNLAGIDVTPAADAALALNGLGRVDWEFQQAVGAPVTPDYDMLAAAAAEVARCAQAVADASTALAAATAALNEIINAVNRS